MAAAVRREEAWKTAEILLLRHQLAVMQRQQPGRPNLDWADRALLAILLSVIPKARRQGLRLLVTPDTILRWHRDIIRHRWAARSHPRQDRSASHPILREYETHHNQHRPHRPLDSAAPLKPLPEPVDLEQYRVRRRARVTGMINEYRLVA